MGALVGGRGGGRGESQFERAEGEALGDGGLSIGRDVGSVRESCEAREVWVEGDGAVFEEKGDGWGVRGEAWEGEGGMGVSGDGV